MRRLLGVTIASACLFAATSAWADDTLSPSTSTWAGDAPPFQVDPIWDGLLMRCIMLSLGGGAVVSGAPEGLSPAFDLHFIGAARESNAVKFEVARFDYLFTNRGHRVGATLADFDEIVIGADNEGAACLPAIFIVWPHGSCKASSGLFGFGLKLLQVDHDFDKGTTGMRVAEGNLRLVVPGAAYGPSYPRFRLPFFAGAAVDWVEGAGAIPRFVGGADVFVRTDDSHVEALFHAAARPSLIDPARDFLFELSGRLTFRWVAPWSGPFALQGVSLDTGWGYASTPGVAIGERFSRTEPHSAWMLLNFELTMLKIGPG